MRSANGKPDKELRKDWKLKQASRSGSHSYVSISEIRTWDRDFESDLDRINAIDKETSLLIKIAPQWSAEEFYSARTAANPDYTKGSEHFVTRAL